MDFAMRVEDKNRSLQWRKMGTGSNKSGDSSTSTFFSHQNGPAAGSIGGKGSGSSVSDIQSTVSFAKSASMSSPTKSFKEFKRLTDKEL